MLLGKVGARSWSPPAEQKLYQLFASHPVDLVLLDYHMPGMNGDIVARAHERWPI